MEFLSGRWLWRYWPLSWCAAPGILLPVTVWWAAAAATAGWTWSAATLIAAAGLAALVVAVFAGCAVAYQDQYDIVSVS